MIDAIIKAAMEKKSPLQFLRQRVDDITKPRKLQMKWLTTESGLVPYDLNKDFLCEGILLGIWADWLPTRYTFPVPIEVLQSHKELTILANTIGQIAKNQGDDGKKLDSGYERAIDEEQIE